MTAILVAAALLTGSLLGLAYFGALWLTAARVARSARPARLLLFSFVLRMSAAAIAFYAVTAWGAAYVPIALVGFLAVRTVMIRWAGADVRRGDPPRSEATEPCS